MSKERLIKTFLSLVEVDNQSLRERKICDYLRERLTELGFSIFEDSAGRAVGGNAGNLYGRLEGDAQKSPVLFCAHMDSVAPAKNKRGRIGTDGRITSEGDTVLGADDLCGIAAILAAVERVIGSEESHRTVEVLFCVAEEVYGKGDWTFQPERIQTKVAYVVDMTGQAGLATYKSPSIITFSARFIGRQSHAGFASKDGINAITAAVAALSRIPQGIIDEQTSVNIGRINGGNATNMVAAECIFEGQVRSFEHNEAVNKIEEIKRICENTADELPEKMEFKHKINIEAYETPLDSPAVKNFEKACEKADIKPILIKSSSGSNNNHLVKAGISGIVMASAMWETHTANEWTTVTELDKVTRIIEELIKL